MRPFFLDRAAELKRRFQSHSSQLNDTSLQSWVGGRSFQNARAQSPLFQNGKGYKFARVLEMTLPPSKALKLVVLAPLRSVPHHNLCSDVTRPPTREMISFFLDRAAELKRRFPIAPHNSAVYQTVEWDGSILNTKLLPQLSASEH